MQLPASLLAKSSMNLSPCPVQSFLPQIFEGSTPSKMMRVPDDLANSSTVCLHTRNVIATLLSLQSLITALIDCMPHSHCQIKPYQRQRDEMLMPCLAVCIQANTCKASAFSYHMQRHLTSTTCCQQGTAVSKHIISRHSIHRHEQQKQSAYRVYYPLRPLEVTLLASSSPGLDIHVVRYRLLLHLVTNRNSPFLRPFANKYPVAPWTRQQV